MGSDRGPSGPGTSVADRGDLRAGRRRRRPRVRHRGIQWRSRPRGIAAVTQPDTDGDPRTCDLTASLASLRGPGMTLQPITFALLGFLLAAVSSPVAGGIAWGAFRAQLERQRDEIHELRTEVRALADRPRPRDPPSPSSPTGTSASTRRPPPKDSSAMSLSDLIRWLTADWTPSSRPRCLAIGYALAWAAIRASYERVVGRPMPPHAPRARARHPRRPRGQRARRRQPVAPEHRARPAVSPGAARADDRPPPRPGARRGWARHRRCARRARRRVGAVGSARAQVCPSLRLRTRVVAPVSRGPPRGVLDHAPMAPGG